MPRKILYVISTLERCGPVNVLYGIVKHLDRQMFAPSILTISPEPQDSRMQDFLDLDVPVESLGLSRWAYAFGGKRALRRALLTLKPDIIHTHGLRADVGVLRLTREIPHCTTLHNNPFMDYPLAYGTVRGELMAKAHTRVLRQIKLPIVVAAHIKNSLHLPSAQVVYNGINHETYTIAPAEARKAIRAGLHVAEDALVFIYPGWLVERKQPLTLIRAFQQSGAQPQDRLLLVGSGPLYETCAREADERTMMIGHVPNVVPYLQAADIYVSAATSEGLPMSVLEGMSCGLYPILSDIPAHRELLGVDPATGSLYGVSKIEELIASMRTIISNRQVPQRSEARKLVLDRFTSYSMSQEYQRLYGTLFEKTTSGPA